MFRRFFLCIFSEPNRLPENLHHEQQTRTGRIPLYPEPVRVSALMWLSLRVRNRTHGGVESRPLKLVGNLLRFYMSLFRLLFHSC